VLIRKIEVGELYRLMSLLNYKIKSHNSFPSCQMRMNQEIMFILQRISQKLF